MNREEARDYITRNPAQHLQRDRSGKGYICPICGSGSGPKGTGITTQDGIHFTCWTGCFQSADVLDIIGQEEGLTTYGEKLERAAELYGITLDGSEPAPHRKAEAARELEQEPAADYREFYREAARHIGETDYHRGISESTLKRFAIGYCESWRNPKNPAAPASPRLIIPFTANSYMARYAGDAPEGTPKAMNAGPGSLFNRAALTRAAAPVFIVEGALDALSIIDAGGEAIALNSTSNARRLLEALDELGEAPAQPLIISMDNDEAGEKTARKLEQELKERGLIFYRANIAGDHKDANEALTADRAQLTARIVEYSSAEKIEQKIKAEARAERRKQSAAREALRMLKTLDDGKRGACIPTGFSSLDKALDGGLYAGLYAIGALSSLGKTTFALQIADQIARRGRDVLIFSLEMARDELIAKSVSRLTFEAALRAGGDTDKARTTRELLTGIRFKGYSAEEREAIAAAFMEYTDDIGQRVYIKEGIGDITPDVIREEVAKHAEIMGAAPVVFVDYLQIMAPADLHMTDKQAIDRGIMELKRISRDFDTPVIGISSFNRENYSKPVNLTAYKESGAIEYSADVLIGLQYAGMDYTDEDKNDKAREARIREIQTKINEDAREGRPQRIQLKILKHRNGSRGDIELHFHPRYNTFREVDTRYTPKEPEPAGTVLLKRQRT